MTRLRRRQAMLLAAILDADGATVSYAVLGAVVGSYGVHDNWVVRQHVCRIRALGVAGVETVARVGCRMTEIPPDWALPDVLAMLDEMRRDGYGRAASAWERTA